MPLNQSELLSVARQLAENENLEVTLKESFKGACMAGGGALMGGILGGPIGLAVGGTVGSIYGAYRGSGKFKSVALVIAEDMSSAQQAQLADSLRNVLQSVQIEDVIMLTSLAMGNAVVKQLIVTEVCRFLRTEMGLAITA